MEKKVVGALVEEARKQYRGEYTDKTQWNIVTIGDEQHLVERGKVIREKINLEDIKFTFAYEKKAHKAQCAFCRMYFEASSVKYKVPNHRLVEKQREWNVVLQGRRYESASFLYSVSCLCAFCAHIFGDVEEAHNKFGASGPQNLSDTLIGALGATSPLKATHSQVLGNGNATSTGSPKLAASGTIGHVNGGGSVSASVDAGFPSASIDEVNKFTLPQSTDQLDRSDVAMNKKAYQSSVVDWYEPLYAVTSLPPTVSNPNNESRTRREADPWWEVDFGMPQNAFRIEFQIASGIQQQLKVFVMLLKSPIGHENPFLSSVKKSASLYKCFEIGPYTKPRLEAISWDLPPETVCSAVRIQLKGINILSLCSFKVLKGDMFVDCTEDDFLRSERSFASLPPNEMFQSIAESLSPHHKRQKAMQPMHDPIPFSTVTTIIQRVKQKTGKFSEVAGVPKLAQFIQDRKDAVVAALARIRMFVDYFSPEEVLAMYRMTFKGCLDEMGAYKGHIEEKDIMNGALMEQFPRIDLHLMLEHVKILLRKIQARSHSKVIEVLLYSEKFVVVANEYDDHLHKLSTAFKVVEKHWKKQKKIHDRIHAKALKESVLKAVANANFDTLEEDKHAANLAAQSTDPTALMGCSWAQFCMIMGLMFSMQCTRIPAIVFGVGEDIPLPFFPTSAQTREYQAMLRARSAGGANYGLGGTTAPSSSGGNVGGGLGATAEAQSLAIGANVGSTSPTALMSNRIGTGFDDASVSSTSTPAIGVLSPNMLNPRPASPMLATAAPMSPGRPHGFGSGTYPAPDTGSPKKWQRPPVEDPALHMTLRDKYRDKTRDYNSQFAEYRLDTVVKKQQLDLPYPKALRADFSRSMVELPRTGLFSAKNKTRPNTSSGGANNGGKQPGNDSDSVSSSLPSITSSIAAEIHDLTYGPPIGGRPASQSNKQGSTMEMRASSPANMSKKMASSQSGKVRAEPSMDNSSWSFDVSKLQSLSTYSSHSSSAGDIDFDFNEGRHEANREGTGVIVDIKDNTGFFKICALCEQRHPRKAMEISVLWKHVLNLKRSWDRNLVSKELELLDQSISMFNFVRVCVFCAQYFDPDFPGGIAAPQRQLEKPSSSMVPFFDNRYPSKQLTGQFLKDPRVLESRARARRAVEQHEAMESAARTLAAMEMFSVHSGSDY